jgi:hypothetical protein
MIFVGLLSEENCGYLVGKYEDSSSKEGCLASVSGTSRYILAQESKKFEEKEEEGGGEDQLCPIISNSEITAHSHHSFIILLSLKGISLNPFHSHIIHVSDRWSTRSILCRQL